MENLYESIIDFKIKIDKSLWDNEIQNTYKKIMKDLNLIPIPKDIETFKIKNKYILYRLYDTFLGNYSFYRVPTSLKNQIRGPIDSFFNKLRIKSPGTYLNYTPTNVFNNFIRGITYFENENPTEPYSPVYHRNKSCGSSTVTSDIKFSSIDSKENVKKCYIERLIYDQLYNYYLHRQDTFHAYELKKIYNYYFDYFPNEYFKIEIKYNKSFYPYQLIITTFKPDSIITEIYTKDWKKELVMCELNYNKKYFYSKINTFTEEKPWKQIKVKTVDFGKKIKLKCKNSIKKLDMDIAFLLKLK